MLAKERPAAILSILQKQGTATVLELTQALPISESTIWWDLVALYKTGKLKKVHGGTMLLYKEYGLYEIEVTVRSEERVGEKKRIARYAASSTQAHDFAYTDAGGTILHMVEYLKEEEAIYATNRLEHGRRLAVQGSRTFLLVDELKSKTEVVVDPGAVFFLQKCNFNKAFFGTNGMMVDSGFTTPDINEMYAKMEAMKYVQRCYVPVDSGKFRTCTSITTADISDAMTVTDKGAEKEYLEETDTIEVEG